MAKCIGRSLASGNRGKSARFAVLCLLACLLVFSVARLLASLQACRSCSLVCELACCFACLLPCLPACYLNALHPMKNMVGLHGAFRQQGGGRIVLFTASALTDVCLLAIHSSFVYMLRFYLYVYSYSFFFFFFLPVRMCLCPRQFSLYCN